MILHEVINRIGVLCTAAVSPVRVFDGPNPPAVNLQRFVVVGSEGEEGDAASVTLEPSTLGPGTWLDESGEIVCSAWSWSGGNADKLPTHRSEALTDAAACVAAIQADRTLGGLLIAPAAVAGGLRYQPVQFDSGPLVRVSFTVAYQHVNT